ncbi:MAG: hypothetical protein QF876_12065 [Desulfobacterales bacterium]|nr:hypothetical protein [Desulfobacterales bacterium]MDP6807901.1 hypothetical protein [Desulfobacterales bacterium]
MAMIFISVAMLATGALLASITGFNRHARQRTAATTLAQDKIEELKNQDYNNITAGSTTETGMDEDGNTGGNAIYDRVTVVDDASYPGMKTIVVTVSWNHMGNNRSVALRTAVAK